jgi:signal transduction histidine kinase/ligand-binding sensor domain-containing protein
MGVPFWFRDCVRRSLAWSFLGLNAFCLASPVQDAGNAHQSPPFVCQTWRVEDGLPQDSVRAITQTRDGYLWVGTGGGLARFDGVHFKVFGLADGLPALHVRALLEDRRGVLWVGTANGLARFEEGRFRNFTTLEGLTGDTIIDLVEDKEGAIWIGTSVGLSRWHDGQFSVPDAKITSVRAMTVDGSGAVLVAGSPGGLLRWDGRRLTPFSQSPEMRKLRPNCLSKDAAGRLWVATQGNAFCLDGTTWRQYGPAEGLPNVALVCMGAGADGTVWVGSWDQGLYALLPGEEHFQAVGSVGGVLDAAVRTLFEDNEKNLWVGTRDSGMTRLRPRRVTVWEIQDDTTKVMPFSLTEAADGTLMVGTAGRGLYHLSDGRPSPFLRKELEPYDLRTGVVLMTRGAGLWFVAASRLFQWQDGRLRQILSSGGVSSLCQDRAGGVWIGSASGSLRRFHDAKLQDFSADLPQAPLTSLVPEDNGALWVGVYGHGVIQFRQGERVSFGKAEGLRSTLIRALYRDGEGVLWVGTEGGGLGRIQAGRINNFGKAEGLPDDTILQILEDESGHLWLGSYHGIIRVGRQDLASVAAGRSTMLHPRVLGRSEGMSSEQCMSAFGGAVKLHDGRLCFATGNGIVVVDPKHHFGSNLPTRVRIEAAVADGQPVPLPGAWLTATEQHTLEPPLLEIGPGRRRFEFQYTGLFLGAPERVRFRHRLVGLDRDWVEAGDARAAYYSHLPPGHYRFEVSAHSGSGLWSEPPVGLDLVLRPFFWQTSWFMLGCGLGLLGLGFGAVRQLERRRVRARVQRLELESAMERERSRIARDIHDDLGARLTKISMLTDLAGRQAPPDHQMAGHLRNIANTAREMLVRLDETVWVVNPRNDQLDRLAEYLFHYAENFFQHTNIRCHFKMSEEIPPLPVAAEPRHHVFLSAKEALNNVARHAGATEVRVHLEFTAGRFALTIQDNGRGFDSAECLARGRGLENMRSRVENLGGRFELHSLPGEGTTVRMAFDVAATLQPKAAPGS